MIRPLEQQTIGEQIMEWAEREQDTNPGAFQLCYNWTATKCDRTFASVLDAKRWAAQYNKRRREEAIGNRFGV